MLFAYTAFIQNCKSICLENCANIVWEILFATFTINKIEGICLRNCKNSCWKISLASYKYFPKNLWLEELQFTLQQKNDLSIHCMSLILKTDVMVQMKYVASIWQKKCVEETPVVFQGNWIVWLVHSSIENRSLCILLKEFFFPFWQFWFSMWVSGGHHSFSFFLIYLTISITNMGFVKWSIFFLCFQYFRQFRSTIWVLDGNQYDQRRFQLWSAPQCIFCNFLSLHRPLCFVESKNGLICVLFPICVSCCPLHVHWPLNIDERCEYLQTWELHQRRTARSNDHRPFGIRAGSVDHCGNTEYRFKLFLPFGIHVCRVDHCDSTEYR